MKSMPARGPSVGALSTVLLPPVMLYPKSGERSRLGDLDAPAIGAWIESADLAAANRWVWMLSTVPAPRRRFRHDMAGQRIRLGRRP